MRISRRHSGSMCSNTFAEDKRTDAVKPTRGMRPFSSIGYGKSLCRVAGGNARRGWRMLAGRSWERPWGNSKKDEPGRRCRASGRASRRPRKISHESGRICGRSFRTKFSKAFRTSSLPL